MKKLKLQVEQIHVDSFEAMSAERRQGTVNAYSGPIFYCGSGWCNTLPADCVDEPISNAC